MKKKLLARLLLLRFLVYAVIIGLFAYYNLSTYDLYLISNDPLTFLNINWFEIVIIILLLAIYYKVSKK